MQPIKGIKQAATFISKQMSSHPVPLYCDYCTVCSVLFAALGLLLCLGDSAEAMGEPRRQPTTLTTISLCLSCCAICPTTAPHAGPVLWLDGAAACAYVIVCVCIRARRLLYVGGWSSTAVSRRPYLCTRRDRVSEPASDVYTGENSCTCEIAYLHRTSL